jgi:hypothetical protein
MPSIVVRFLPYLEIEIQPTLNLEQSMRQLVTFYLNQMVSFFPGQVSCTSIIDQHF